MKEVVIVPIVIRRDYTILGILAMVLGDVEPHMVYVGNPASGLYERSL